MRAVQKLAADRSITIDDICGSLKISRSTYYRYLSLGAGPSARARALEDDDSGSASILS